MVAPPVAKVAVSVVAFGKAAVQLEAGDVSFHVAPSPPPVHVPVEAPALRDNPNDDDKRIRRYLEVFIGFGGLWAGGLTGCSRENGNATI